MFYFYFNKQRNYDMMASILANFGLILGLMSYEHVIFEYDVNGIDTERWPIASQHPRVTCSYSAMCRWTLFITTVMAIGCLFIRQKYKTQWLNSYFNEDIDTDPSNVDLIHEDPETRFLEWTSTDHRH